MNPKQNKSIYRFIQEYFKIVAIFLSFTIPQSVSADEFVLASGLQLHSVDPHLAYDTLSYNLLALTCRRINHIYADGTIAPDLAFIKETSEDGLSITYELKNDSFFSDGSAITAHDISYSFHRVLSPTLGSPGGGYFSSLSGAGEYSRGEAEQVQGIEVLSDSTIRLQLDRPSQAFRYALATNFACVVKDSGQGFETLSQVTSGPFKILPQELDNEVLLESQTQVERNWLPNVSTIRVLLNVSDHDVITGIMRGEIDLLIDDPTTRSRAMFEFEGHNTLGLPALGTTYIALNVNQPPFDDLNMRQAVNHAVDRVKLSALMGVGNVPSSQILPSAFDAHVPELQPYSYDVEAAAKLVEESPTRDRTITMYTLDTDSNRTLALAIASDLREIGLTLNIAMGDTQAILEVAADPERGSMILSEGLGWVADHPNEASFFESLHTRASISDHGWNWSHYDDPVTERLAHYADSLVGSDLRAQRAAAWRAVFERLESNAHWVPLYHRSITPLTSLSFGRREIWAGEASPYSAMPFLSGLRMPSLPDKF